MLSNDELVIVENAKKNNKELPEELKAKILAIASEEASICCQIFSGTGYIYQKLSPSICKKLGGEEVSDGNC